MAAQKKKTNKKSAAKKNKRPIRREVGGIVCLLLALCVLVSYFGIDAVLLTLLATLLKGLFGYGYWLCFPALVLSAYILWTHHGRPVRLRITCALLLPLFFGVILHLLLCRTNYELSGSLLALLWQDGQQIRCGGALCGAIAVGLSAVLSKVVTVVIFLVLLAVAIFVSLRVSPKDVVQKARDRIPYEEEPLPEKRVRKERISRRERAQPAQRPVYRQPERPAARRRIGRPAIDIPIDEEATQEVPVRPEPKPMEPEVVRAAETVPQEPILSITPKKNFFSKKPAEVRTPAEALQPKAKPEPEEEPLKLSRDEMASITEEVSRDIENELAEPEEVYQYPPIDLLHENHADNYTEVGAELRSNSQRLAATLRSFGVDAQAGEVVHGPSVTRYEFTLDQGVKLSKITNLADDIALALGASGVRIAPIPNKLSVVGIEVPNRAVTPVCIRDVIESREFTTHKSRVAFAVGKDIGGNAIVGNIGKLPHVLIAGTTGSGKSVCTNSLIVSLLYKSTPEEVRFIMVDPKMVELAPYNGIPHLLIPVVTDPKKAAGALQWAVFEMMKRYKLFSENGVKDLEGFNELCRREQEKPEEERNEQLKKTLPTVVVVIDELADLMLVAAKEVEESICRVAQMGRAAGMHLVIATQRPSADVITGLMKANIPSRIAFAVASSLESRIILDTTGAEKLVGKGDMLYFPLGNGKPTRVQGCFISPEEIERVVAFVKEKSGEAEYSTDVINKIEEALRGKEEKNSKASAAADSGDDCDELLPAAVDVVLELGQASVSMLQRRLKLGYSRAARLVDQMEERGIVGPFEGSKPRQLLIDRAKWQEMQMTQNGGEPEPSFDRDGSIRDVFDSHDALD
ncbi:MAG: DNA translocase FtsK [Clostridiales bacterium]|nr:DNA translocase FtsK [Candidatus Cacconaster stercorequi]